MVSSQEEEDAVILTTIMAEVIMVMRPSQSVKFMANKGILPSIIGIQWVKAIKLLLPEASSTVNYVRINENVTRNAFLATPETVMDPYWFTNSGATSHVTFELGNLNLNSDYKRKEKFMIGDGKLLSITHTGLSILPNSSLKFKNILRVPTIAKNLVSISKLTADNNVFVEFHPNVCFVKNSVTGNIVLRRRLKDGLNLLNELAKIKFGSALTTELTSSSST